MVQMKHSLICRGIINVPAGTILEFCELFRFNENKNRINKIEKPILCSFN